MINYLFFSGEPAHVKLENITPKKVQFYNSNSVFSNEYNLLNKYRVSADNVKANFTTAKIPLSIDKIKKLVPECTYYINTLCKIDNGKLINDVILSLKDSQDTQIKDFFRACAKLNLQDKNSLILLAKTGSRFSESTKLEQGANIQDNWLRKILSLRQFSNDQKFDTIMRSCKESKMGQVIKNSNLFSNTDDIGNVPGNLNYEFKSCGESKSYGIFTNDTMFISDYNVSIIDNNSKPLKLSLNSNQNDGIKASYNLTGKDININRSQLINKAFYEKITAQNNAPVQKVLNLNLESKIRDVMDVRGMKIPKGPYESIKTDDYGVIFNTIIEPNRKLGVKVLIKVDGKPFVPDLTINKQNNLNAKIVLPARQIKNIEVQVIPLLNNKAFVDGQIVENIPKNYELALQEANNNNLVNQVTKVQILGSGSLKNAQAIYDRANSDLKILTNALNVDNKNYNFIVAGIPRYACLFGRDSIITAMEMLPINKKIAKDIIELLAKYQGKHFGDRYAEALAKGEVDKEKFLSKYREKEEAEGKILHELRVGELARQGKIPFTPYYGTVDATALWLMLISDYYKWTGDKETVKNLTPQIDKALKWIDSNSSDGFLRFVGTWGKEYCLDNQGWKDSSNSLEHTINKDGILSKPKYPVALAEVQGYVYAAKQGISRIYSDLGKTAESKKLEQEALKLKENFNKKYWVDSEQFIAMALDADGKPVPSVSSNAGQCLFTNIIDPDKAREVEKRLMSNEMYSGWGIRTLSSKSPAYDEMSYHNGSIWPHDTALVAKGFSNNYNKAIITKSLYEAASTFEHNRMPELYGGFQRKPNDKTIQTYPEVCWPQAWSSASIIEVLFSSLGIEPDIKNRSLKLNNPVLPEGMSGIKISNIEIDNQKLNLDISKQPDNSLIIKATNKNNVQLFVNKQGNNYRIGY